MYEFVDESYGLYINKEKEIFPYISQEELFELILGELPEEYEKFHSPLRPDTNPGCWLEYDVNNGRLFLRDFGYGDMPLDCIGTIQVVYHLPSYYDALYYIKAVIIQQGKREKKYDILDAVNESRIEFKKVYSKIYTQPRPFNGQDRAYWLQYGITRKNLEEDEVYPLEKFRIISKKGDRVYICHYLTYSYQEFSEKRKKLYTPYNKKHKFITNCTNNDIGGSGETSDSLIITKSYKDYRVLKNLGYNNRWFQNEGQIPNDVVLISLISDFKKITILYDNDDTGYQASVKLRNKIINLSNIKTNTVFIPKSDNVTDISDYYLKYGRCETINLLKNLI